MLRDLGADFACDGEGLTVDSSLVRGFTSQVNAQTGAYVEGATVNAMDRDRLVNLVLRIASAVPGCPQKKLFAILYVADVVHFRGTGRTITRLAYFAGSSAPYPHHLSHELRGHLRPDLNALIALRPDPADDSRHLVFGREGMTFNDEQFTRRQLATVEAVLTEYGPLSLDAFDFDRVDNGAFHRALGRGKHKPVHFEEAVDKRDENSAAVLAQAAEYRGREQALAIRD